MPISGGLEGALALLFNHLSQLRPRDGHLEKVEIETEQGSQTISKAV